jgi:hypothetical protein
LFLMPGITKDRDALLTFISRKRNWNIVKTQNI